MATERALSKKDEKRHPSRLGRIKKTRKKLESTATEIALSKKRTCGKYETSRQQQNELEFDLFELVST
jgi:hypothetical protein